MYTPKYFQIKELVSPKIYKKHAENSIELLNQNLLKMIDDIHDFFNGIMIVNTWSFSKDKQDKYGHFEYRGYREPGCGVGIATGAHYLGQAIDFDLYKDNKKVDTAYIYKELIKNKEKFPHLSGIELANWTHVDVMKRNNQPENKIVVFSPRGFLKYA